MAAHVVNLVELLDSIVFDSVFSEYYISHLCYDFIMTLFDFYLIRVD